MKFGSVVLMTTVSGTWGSSKHFFCVDLTTFLVSVFYSNLNDMGRVGHISGDSSWWQWWGAPTAFTSHQGCTDDTCEEVNTFAKPPKCNTKSFLLCDDSFLETVASWNREVCQQRFYQLECVCLCHIFVLNNNREEWALDQLADVEENLFRSTCE